MYKEFDELTKDELVASFKTVVADAEALLKATATHGSEELAGVRSKAEESIEAMKSKMAGEQTAVLAFSRDAAKTADVYVHMYPWTAIGVAAGVGLVVGLFSHR